MTAYVVPSDKEALTDDEADRITRIRIAKWYGGINPEDIVNWDYSTVLDTLETMEADNTIADIERQRAAAKMK